MGFSKKKLGVSDKKTRRSATAGISLAPISGSAGM
jgi:hypothetical protein